jgi:hypothetical protein
MIEFIVFVAGVVMYRWFFPRMKRHKCTQTELTRIHRGTQTDNEYDSMSMTDSMDLENLDEFFFSDKL